MIGNLTKGSRVFEKELGGPNYDHTDESIDKILLLVESYVYSMQKNKSGRRPEMNYPAHIKEALEKQKRIKNSIPETQDELEHMRLQIEEAYGSTSNRFN